MAPVSRLGLKRSLLALAGAGIAAVAASTCVLPAATIEGTGGGSPGGGGEPSTATSSGGRGGAGGTSTASSTASSSSSSGANTGAGGGDGDLDAGCGATQAVAAWAAWRMPNSPDAGLPNPASYTDNEDGTVTDDVTHLMWEKAVTGVPVDWAAAKQHCAALVFAGHCDWRLPSRIELLSIVDLSRAAPAIDPVFPSTPQYPFWSSSAFYEGDKSAWIVQFADGHPGLSDVTAGLYYSRCVR
jgi:Protein of unknown function (DUF1566)